MNITPQRDLVLVELIDAQPASASGIEIVRFDKQPSQRARVLAVGPDVREVRVGARYVISRLQGIEIAEKLLLPEGAFLAEVP